MNPDPFEKRLLSLRPGTLPETLQERLAEPPAPVRAVKSKIVRIAFAASAAAACALLWPRGTESIAPDSTPVLASQRSSRITDVKPLSVITDAADRPWKFVQVNWVEEDTLVSARRPAAIQTRDSYATVVPIAIHFD